jgi:hypothetical protein
MEMREEDRESLNEETKKSLETFLARTARFASEGRLVPRMNPGMDLGEVRRMIHRLRAHEVGPLFDWTHEETADFFEACLQQEEIIRGTVKDMKSLNGLERQFEEKATREQTQRDVEAFHTLKAEAELHGGDQQLLRELHRARRAAGGRSRGRR